EYSYSLRVSKRAKYMRLQVSQEKGLELIIPYGISLKEAERFLNTKKDWISKYVGRFSNNKYTYMYLGSNLEIDHQYDLYIKKHRVELEGNKLKILSPSQNKSPVKSIFTTWLKIKANNYIPERVYYLAGKYGFHVNKVTIRDQKTRWGSCSRLGNLSFNFKLMVHSEDVIDYVIIHELCHLKELNHSSRFWYHVERILPNYKTLRRELKKII
ncbi:MAG: M48 family metallopeptidase, partial [Bacillota bacterium]